MDTNIDRVIHNFLQLKTQGAYSLEAFQAFKDFVLYFAKADQTLSLERIVLNFFNEKQWTTHAISDVNVFYDFALYIKDQKELPKYKVALLFICINQPYWEFAKNVIEDAKKFFLPGHDVDMFLWSDMKENPGVKQVFEADPIEWPGPTLYRYNLMLQQEELLKKYDYVMYCDIDMRIVNYVGDEILGDGLTAAQHPMYAFKQALWIPYEPNEKSAAYIPRPGKIIFDSQTGQNKFMPLFYAGGFQGGKTEPFIKAMKRMIETIDQDMAMGYTALWNEQAHWNKYLFENPPSVILTPSYIYPDSLIKEYYEPIWGTNYPPKIITLTKKFSVQRLDAKAVADIQSMSQLKGV